MSSIVISVSEISKQYRLGVVGMRTFSEDFSRFVNRFLGKEDPFLKSGAENVRDIVSKEDFVWALQNISFDVRQGEILGIVGRNGAGKSTLLKILSRVTAPTTGEMKVKGRIASLLEVGTGFHPELTGRENIFLNGAILGMTRHEIKSKFEEIVEFSGVQRYIDTPVKRYSSGMYVRLAFAVAAHLEPEILIVDEVLAVGDATFQKKCLGKMKDVSGGGRTILFVSHNMNAVRSLCNRCLLLRNGKLIADGSTDTVLKEYDKSLRELSFSDKLSIGNEQNRRGSGLARFSEIKVTNQNNEETEVFNYGETIVFHLTVLPNQDMEHVYASIMLRSGMYREPVTSSQPHLLPFPALKKGEPAGFKITVHQPVIRPGEYPLYFWLADKNKRPLDIVDDIIPPLIIQAKDDMEKLGFDPTVHSGYFSIATTISK